MGMYFEDFEIGHVSRTRGRTVTEADVVNFAGVSGDFVELHVNEEFAKAGPFGDASPTDCWFCRCRAA